MVLVNSHVRQAAQTASSRYEFEETSAAHDLAQRQGILFCGQLNIIF